MARSQGCGHAVDVMLIREPRDTAEVADLAQTTQHARSGLVVARRRAIHLSGDLSRVGEIDGEPVALGSLRGGSRHPDMVEMAIDAVEGVEDALAPMVDVLIEAAGDRIVECKTADGDAVSQWVRRDHRFRHEITVQLGSVPTSGRPQPLGLLPARYSAEALEEMTPEVERLFERIYAEQHAWTGTVVEFPESGSWVSSVGEPVAIGVVWNRTGEAVAVSGVTIGTTVEEGAYLLPGGVIAAERSHRVEIFSHALEAALAAAARLGVPKVDFEDSRPDYAIQGAVLDRFERNVRDTTEMWISRDR